MRLRARVQRGTGGTRHHRAHIEGEDVHRDEELPTPASVEIQPVDGAFFLLYLDEHGECLTDTWHQTLAQAKAQARHEFGIGEDDWEDLGT
ncbi:MAG: hypothetical protein HYV07_11040 [Deltaproteobacteria bacterium]|nr:hypothetical protein [Deltaproteobacteria bacterium]